LRREWEEVKGRAGAEAEKAQALWGWSASNAFGRAEMLLVGFAEKLRGVRVLDPACGSRWMRSSPATKTGACESPSGPRST
jgi:hypothetical protein